MTENQIQPQMVTALGALELDGSDTGQLYASRVLPSETIFQFIELAQLSGLIAECSESRCPQSLGGAQLRAGTSPGVVVTFTLKELAGVYRGEALGQLARQVAVALRKRMITARRRQLRNTLLPSAFAPRRCWATRQDGGMRRDRCPRCAASAERSR